MVTAVVLKPMGYETMNYSGREVKQKIMKVYDELTPVEKGVANFFQNIDVVLRQLGNDWVIGIILFTVIVEIHVHILVFLIMAGCQGGT